MRAVIRVFCSFCIKSPREHTVFHQCEQKYCSDNLGPEMKEKISNQIRKKMALIGALVTQGIEEGLIIDKPAIQITAVASAMLDGISNLLSGSFLKNLIDDPEELIQLTEDTLIRGFKAD